MVYFLGFFILYHLGHPIDAETVKAKVKCPHLSPQELYNKYLHFLDALKTGGRYQVGKQPIRQLSFPYQCLRAKLPNE